MTDALAHRGPDASGCWADVDAGLALGHRRLSVVDLSANGAQPMLSAQGRLVITFNGEIYNASELRAELTQPWRGHSDTEVLVQAIECWGLEAVLPRLNGMFAFALWDRAERALYIARDRFGEKPLYYCEQSGHFYFASELKAFAVHPRFCRRIDEDAIAAYMRCGYIPAPMSAYENVSKLDSGSWLKVSAGAGTSRPFRYWSASQTAAVAMDRPFNGDRQEATEQFHSLLLNSVRSRMTADVPLGAFLSGGIDSSLVVAAMCRAGGSKISTFTVGFDSRAHNEAPYAAAIARYLGTTHDEVVLTAADALAVVPRLARIYDEPFADSSQIPTVLITETARRHVTVALSGDGGDESFGGYSRYEWTRQLALAMVLPSPIRGGLARIAKNIPHSALQVLRGRAAVAGDRALKLAEILSACTIDQLYLKLMTQQDSSEFMLSGVPANTSMLLFDPARWPEMSNLIERMMLLDTLTYLPDDILVKVDRASMAVGLECRVPLLDPKIFEFAWQLPLELKVTKGVGKRILRKTLRCDVPSELFERPKKGFGVPMTAWLRHELRPWAEELLSSHQLNQSGLLNAASVRQRWNEHLSGVRNWSDSLWRVLMFQAWRLETRSAA